MKTADMMSTAANSWTGKEKILLGLSGLLLAFACFMQWRTPAAGGQAWLLMAARMWLDGGKLYVDIFEVNPPLIIWLYAIPAFVAEHAPVFTISQCLALMAFGVVGLTLWLCDGLIALHPQATGRRRVMFALLLAAMFILFVNPLYSFDREHLFILLVFPYLLRFAPAFARMRLRRGFSAVIGVMAAVGFCIKPHCAIVFAGAQLIVLLRERRAFMLVSLENALVYSLSALYLLAVWHYTPDYYTIVLPMALATYGGFSNPDNLLFYAMLSFLTAAVTLVDFRLRYRTAYRRDIYYFLMLLPFLVAYVLLNNGWPYTYVPLNAILALLCGLVLLDQYTLYKEQGIALGLHGVKACTLVLVTKGMITVVIYALALYADFDGRDYPDLRHEKLVSFARHHPVNTFGALLANFGMLLSFETATGAQLVTRFNHLWMLPRFIASGPDFTREHAWIPAYVAHAFADDLRHHKPDIVLVDASPSFFRTQRQVNVPALLSAYPDFREEWKHYRLDESIDGCAPRAHGRVPDDCRFELYGRMQ